MSIETGPRRHPHESIPVQLIRDKRLSFRARGIVIRLLSNAPGFRMTAEDLARESLTEGRFAVLSALKELRKYGYAKVIRSQDERGRWSTVTRVSGWPEPECNDCTSATEVQSPNVGVPNSGGPTFGDCTPKSSSTKKSFQEETTTTTPATLDWSANGLKTFTEEDRVVVVSLLNGHNQQTQQAILDEFAGCNEDSVIKNSPMGLLGKLVASAHNGKFVLNRGRRIRDARIARATPAAKRAPGESIESPFQNKVSYAHQTFGPGAPEPNESAFNREIADAVERWPEEARKYSVAALTYGKRDMHKQSKHNQPTMQGASP